MLRRLGAATKVDQITETPFGLNEFKPNSEILALSLVSLPIRRDRGRNIFDDIAAISKRCKIGAVGDEHGRKVPASHLPLFDCLDRLFDVSGSHPEKGETDSNLWPIDRKALPPRVWYQRFELNSGLRLGVLVS